MSCIIRAAQGVVDVRVYVILAIFSTFLLIDNCFREQADAVLVDLLVALVGWNYKYWNFSDDVYRWRMQWWRW
jgi:hypothetical protein